MILDISKFQKENQIDWKKLSSQIDGVYIKATEGTGYVDPEFHNHVKGAQSANVRLGFYHYATLNNNDVIADSASEAKALFEATKGINVTLPFALDIEKNPIGLNPSDVLKYIENFVLTLKSLGINDIVIYSYTPFLNENLPKDHGLGDKMSLWVAAYTKELKLPNGWNKAWLWQFTSEGIINGITGKVDISKLWE